MTDPLPREDVIELLNRLGSDRDEDVLEAAREVHARITAAGASWEELLVPDQAEAAEDDSAADADADVADADEDGADADEDGDGDSPDREDETGAPPGAKDAESLALIDKLLASSGISADLREELEGYKTDIAAGEFETRDHRYLSAVYKRLSKNR